MDPAGEVAELVEGLFGSTRASASNSRASPGWASSSFCSAMPRFMPSATSLA